MRLRRRLTFWRRCLREASRLWRPPAVRHRCCGWQRSVFPEYANCISMALTPMVLTARLIRGERPDAKIVFIGPCAAKKLEAMRKSVRSEVDFVLTFEEMDGIFDAKHVDVENIEEDAGGRK